MLLHRLAFLLLFTAFVAPAQTGNQSPLLGQTWAVRPLLRFGDPLPVPGGKLEQIDTVHDLGNGLLAFFGRHGKVEKTRWRVKENPWALFGLGADGAVKLVIQSGVPFDSVGGKDLIARFYGPEERGDMLAGTKFHLGKGMLYWDTKSTLVGDLDHVHGWDGRALVKVAHKGMTVRTRTGRALNLEAVSVHSILEDGQALLAFRAAKPDHRTSGYLLLSGAEVKETWVDSEPPAGSVTATKDLIAARQALVKDPKRFPNASGYTTAVLEAFVPVESPGSRALLSVSLLKTRYVSGGFSGNVWVDGREEILKRRPGLYLLDGGQFTEIPFEPGGEALAAISDEQAKRGIRSVVEPITLRGIPGARGAIAALPVFAVLLQGSNLRYLDTGSSTPTLLTMPALRTEPPGGFTPGDILGWNGPDQAFAKTPKGFFLLTRK